MYSPFKILDVFSTSRFGVCVCVICFIFIIFFLEIFCKRFCSCQTAIRFWFVCAIADWLGVTTQITKSHQLTFFPLHTIYIFCNLCLFFLFCYESVWFRILFELHTNHLNDLLANTGEMVVRPLVPIPFLQASKSLDVYACVCNNNCLNLYRKCNLVARFGKFAQSSRINN